KKEKEKRKPFAAIQLSQRSKHCAQYINQGTKYRLPDAPSKCSSRGFLCQNQSNLESQTTSITQLELSHCYCCIWLFFASILHYVANRASLANFHLFVFPLLPFLPNFLPFAALFFICKILFALFCLSFRTCSKSLISERTLALGTKLCFRFPLNFLLFPRPRWFPAK